MISVVVALYNKAPFVGQAVRSALNQKNAEFEIIVCDDCSTDGYELPNDSRIKVIRTPDRSGPSFARNLAVAHSRGEFILPLDADDWIEPDFLERTAVQMTGNAGIVSTGMWAFGESDYYFPASPQTLETELRVNEIPCCSLVRRQAFEEAGGYNSALDGIEDWGLWLGILKRGWTHAVVDAPLFHYRKTDTGMNADADARKEKLVKTLHEIYRPG